MKKQPPPKEMTVRVERSFCMEGEPVPVGMIITLPTSFALSLIHAKKAVRSTALPSARPEKEGKDSAPKAESKTTGKKAAGNQSPVAPAQGE